MKKFLINVLGIIIIVICSLFVLDFAYTKVYNHSNPRTKLQYLLKLNNQSLDVLFLGSSRVANHIDVKLFDQLSHKKTLNMGVEGAGLNDNLLQLKLFLSQNKVKTIVLQIDNNIETTTPSNISKAEAMPFIKNKIIESHIKEYSKENYFNLTYIPFYRYAINDSKIGFRECFFSIINKKPNVAPSIGYTPKFGNSIPVMKTTSLGKSEPLQTNEILLEIQNICKNKNVQLIYFIAPYCSKIKTESFVAKLKKILPNLIDLSHDYDDNLFFNCGHLNDKGAQLLTRRLFLAVKNKI